MREIRPSGSEGGGAKLALPTPIVVFQLVLVAWLQYAHPQRNRYADVYFSLPFF
jgi:hypothetical protein